MQLAKSSGAPRAAAGARVATWNVEWAKPGSKRGDRVTALLRGLDADILVVTEGFGGLLPDEGHVIDAGDDWGYTTIHGRRKTLAWSRHPWRDVRRIDKDAGKGRVVAGVTDTKAGPVKVIAVCIPWPDAHVRTGRRDAARWDEHLECCTQLAAFRRDLGADPYIIAGDYNQRIPPKGQPQKVAASLDAALAGMTVWTRGEDLASPGLLIDHIAGTDDLSAHDVVVWAGNDEQGRLSDHDGVACIVGAAPPT
jgi:hypothetical protein